MSAAVAEFRHRHPRVSLKFQTENSSRSCFDALAAHDMDLAWITIGAPVRGIEQRRVIDLPWVLAGHADDPLATRSRIELHDLAGIRHIRLPENSTSRAGLDAALAEWGVHVTSDTGVADWDTAILLAELGFGHAVVPPLERPRPPFAALRPDPGPPRSVGGPEAGLPSPLARAFADLVSSRSGPGALPDQRGEPAKAGTLCQGDGARST